jgi:hypothetical protein
LERKDRNTSRFSEGKLTKGGGVVVKKLPAGGRERKRDYN